MDTIAIIISLIIALCLPVWVYGAYKLLPIAYDRLNAVLQVTYGWAFKIIDQWANDWKLR